MKKSIFAMPLLLGTNQLFFATVSILGQAPRIKVKEKPIFHALWMDEYFNDYIHRDIQRLFPRINRHNFSLFIQSLCFSSGKIINQSTIARALEISSVTAKEYLEILHHLLKLDDVDQLLVHPQAGNSFESFIIEEIIRGFQCTVKAGIDFNFYRTRDKSEVDFIVDGSFGIIPIEVKLGTKIKPQMLVPIKNFLKDTDSKFGLVVNNSDKIEWLADNIIQIPAIYV